MTSYHAGPPEGAAVAGAFLDAPRAACPREWVLRLDGRARRRKRRMFEAYRSQLDVLRPLGALDERVRCPPRYDFGRNPHPGELLYYERLPFGWTGAAVSSLLLQALREQRSAAAPRSCAAALSATAGVATRSAINARARPGSRLSSPGSCTGSGTADPARFEALVSTGQ